MDNLIVPSNLKPSEEILTKVSEFLRAYSPYEITKGGNLLLYYDEKSNAYYVVCHLLAKALVHLCDNEATLDATEDDELYKLNREITEDESAFKIMVEDASNGRSFEDLVLEYDTSYRDEKPLKVYGGQHRLTAISKVLKSRAATVHGIRVYFCLSREQKVEIATVNNTSIAVPNDLLDRMREQLLGSELRDFCQEVGLLQKGEDFADRKSPDAPTVRIARTLVVNFELGRQAKEIDSFHQPIVCKSGGTDETYLKMRSNINWKDEKLLQLGREFSRLHKVQRNRVQNRSEEKNAEFARKALSLSVVASWAYAAGLFQNDDQYLKAHYALSDSVAAPDDPLNAKALSQARHKLTDPDTYRGLGTRYSSQELGRMLELFLVFATKASKKKITKDLANAAIQSYEAKRATFEADKVLKKI